MRRPGPTGLAYWRPCPDWLGQTKRPDESGLGLMQTGLAVERYRAGPLGDDVPGVFRQLFGLRQKIEGLEHLRIGFRPHLLAFLLAESVYADFALDVGA